jgi:hypothetical protein
LLVRAWFVATSYPGVPGIPSERLESARGRISASPRGVLEMLRELEEVYLGSVGDMNCDEVAVPPGVVGVYGM